MGEIKQINIENRTYYFYKDVIDLDEFDGSKIKVNKKNLMTLVFIILDMNIRKKLQNVICMVFNSFWWCRCCKKIWKYLEKY